MSTSKIEWTEATWNPIVGCSILTPGCTNCYAMKMAARLEKISLDAKSRGVTQVPHYVGTTKLVNGFPVWTGKMAFAGDEILLQPLKRKKPTTYFVNSMGDLFHEDVPDEWIDKVFAVMALAPQHTFQVLTKRAARMRDYFSKPLPKRDGVVEIARGDKVLDAQYDLGSCTFIAQWPLPNVWLGVSAERQQEWDERKEHLRSTPAAVRFVSFEPLLGGIVEPRPLSDFLQWAIVGGESGHGARPMHPDWARSLRDQCQAAGVAFFFKQWGVWRAEIDRDQVDPDWRQPYADYREPHFQMLNLAGGRGFHGERLHVMRWCSKKSAGRLLDGVEHNAIPLTAYQRPEGS